MPFLVSNTNYFKAIDFYPFSQENLPYTIGVGVVTLTALGLLGRHLYQTYSATKRNIQPIAHPVALQPAEVTGSQADSPQPAEVPGAQEEVKPEPPKPRQLIARPMSELQKKIGEHPLGAVFEHLTPQEIITASRVCKAWHAASSEDLFWEGFDVEDLFPKFSLVNEETWDSLWDLDDYGLQFTDSEGPKKRAVILKLNQIFHAFKQNQMWIKGDAGINQLTLPMGLNYEKFNRMVEPADEWEGMDIFVRGIDVQKLDRFKVSSTCTFLIANGILEGKFSQHWGKGGTMSLETCNEHLKKTAGGEVAQLLPFVANIALTYLTSPEEAQQRLFAGSEEDENYGLVFDQIALAPSEWDSGKRRVGDFQGKRLCVLDCTYGPQRDQSGRLTAMWRV